MNRGTKTSVRRTGDDGSLTLDNTSPVLAALDFHVSTPAEFARRIADFDFPEWVISLELKERGELLMWRLTSGVSVTEEDLRDLHKRLSSISQGRTKLVVLLMPDGKHLKHVDVIKSDSSFKSVDIVDQAKQPSQKSGPRPIPTSRTAQLEKVIEETIPASFGPWKSWLSGLKLSDGSLTYAQIKVSVPEDSENEINAWSSRIEESLGIPVIVFPENIRRAFEKQLSTTADSDGIIRDPAELRHHLQYLHGTEAPDPGPAQKLPLDIPGLVDLREACSISLDPLGAADIDDIIYAKRQDNGDIRLIVSFADVSWRIPPRSELDYYARRICFSQYGRLETLPMLGPALSFDELSLKQDQDRMAFSVSIRVAPDGNVSFEQIFRSVVRNHFQGSYEEFDKLLAVPDRKLQETLSAAMEATQRLQHGREGQPNILKPRDYGSGYSMVSEAMIAAKHIVARYCWKRNIPILYRVQTEPTYAEMVELIKRLGEYGIEAEIKDLQNAARFKNLKNELRSSGHNHLLRDILDILDRRALYYALNRGHFGLALDAYADIKGRHYAGLLTQRQLGSYLAGQPLMTASEIHKAQRLVNRKERARYDNLFRLLVLEELIDNLAKTGRSFSGTVIPGKDGSRLLKVAGFRKADFLSNNSKHTDFSIDDDEGTDADTFLEGLKAVVRLEGYDLHRKSYVFSMISGL